jgi:tRNA(Ile)-lysidine synthase
MPKNLAKKIQENIFRYELFGCKVSARGGSAFGGKIVVGVSGGPDSVCLLNTLEKLKGKYNIELLVAHVNYGLRGKDSDLDEKLVKDLAKKYSLKIEVKKIPNTKRQTPNTQSEEKLRLVRYNFFDAVCKKHKAGLIAVGHNMDDQAETILMRLLRGTGLRGLGAIKFKNRNVIRPLLNIPRKEILAYLRSNKIAYRIDRTNLENNFTRNKIRNKLLPCLEKEYNPNIGETLYKFSESAALDYDFLSRYAGEWLSRNEKLRVSALMNLHPSLRNEVLRLAIEKHIPELKEIGSAHIDEILKMLRSNKSKRQKIAFRGLKIERIGDNLNIAKTQL